MNSLPKHVAVIMDGNGRWANSRGLPRVAGHRAGAKSVRTLVESCRKLGVEYLTLFSFSTENWGRTREEISSLMSIFKEYLESELRDPELLRNGVRLRAVGDIDRLPLAVRVLLNQVMERTKSNTSLTLVLALSYGGREDILQATKSFAADVKAGRCEIDSLSVETFRARLWTQDIPEPDLMIRTSGEKRISNFLLWQLAYAELVVVDEFWPDFDEQVFRRCLEDYANRERRFGLTSAQLTDQKVRGA